MLFVVGVTPTWGLTSLSHNTHSCPQHFIPTHSALAQLAAFSQNDYGKDAACYRIMYVSHSTISGSRLIYGLRGSSERDGGGGGAPLPLIQCPFAGRCLTGNPWKWGKKRGRETTQSAETVYPCREPKGQSHENCNLCFFMTTYGPCTTHVWGHKGSPHLCYGSFFLIINISTNFWTLQARSEVVVYLSL